jgi:tetratricopeptide (TPR) repeat protein
VTDTLRSRLQALPPGSRRLAAAFALSGRQSMALEELLCLTGCDTPGEAHAALEALVAADVLISDNDEYAFRHAGWATPVLETLDPSARRTRHAELAAFYERGDTDPLASVYHRLLANEPRRALSTLEPFLMERDVHAANIFSLTGLSPEKLGTLFDMALRVAEEHGASPRVLGRLRHFVLAMGVMVDERWFLQLAPDVGEFLKRESGWYAWQETDPSASPMDRVVAAIGQAQAAYDAAPDDAAYAPGEAIRQLVQHAVASIAVGVRASDLPMLEGLPALLEPFAPLTPIVNTIYENTIATWDSALGRHESARERYQAVLERLQDVDVAALEHADEIRDAVTYGIATAEVRMGLPSADQWLDRLSHNPRYGVSRLILRSVLAMQAGDWSTADALRGQAELLLLQSDATQLFGSSDVRLELEARAVALDLRAVKQLLPRVEALAAKMPGWSAYMHLARGELARLRGDGSRALAEYDESIAVATEGDWEAPSLSFHTAAAAKLEMLVELGRAEEALPLGRRYLALDAEAPPGVRLHGIWRAMALAHAQQGDGEAAQALMSQLHAAREALGGSSMHLGLLHEADTLIALWTGDATGAATALKKTAECFLAHGGAGFGARYGRLLGETRNSMAGAAIPGDSAPPTGTTATETAATRVGELMTSLTDARLRAARGLELLCEQAGATGGHLYLQQPEGLVLAASLGQSPPPDDLQAFVQQCFQAEVTGLDGPTETATMTAAGPIGGTLLATDGRRYHPMWIRARLGGATSLLGVAALLLDDRAAPDLSAYEVAAALGDHLLQTGDAITACSS